MKLIVENRADRQRFLPIWVLMGAFYDCLVATCEASAAAQVGNEFRQP